MLAQRSAHRLHLQVVLLPEHGQWVAQALDHDFAAQGATQEEALSALVHTIGSHIYVAKRRGIADPLANVPAAPDTYWSLFERAAKIAGMKGEELDGVGLPAFIIQAAADQELIAQ
jgi:hypothetical protein